VHHPDAVAAYRAEATARVRDERLEPRQRIVREPRLMARLGPGDPTPIDRADGGQPVHGPARQSSTSRPGGAMTTKELDS
jgi:hypothetical protein